MEPGGGEESAIGARMDQYQNWVSERPDDRLISLAQDAPLYVDNLNAKGTTLARKRGKPPPKKSGSRDKPAARPGVPASPAAKPKTFSLRLTFAMLAAPRAAFAALGLILQLHARHFHGQSP